MYNMYVVHVHVYIVHVYYITWCTCTVNRTGTYILHVYMYMYVCMYVPSRYICATCHVCTFVCAHVSSSFLVVDTAGPRVYTYCT